MVLIIIGALYVGLLLGDAIGFLTTGFIPPKGLWLLVPFRVSGWRSQIYPGKVYNIRWGWEKIDFSQRD